MKIRWFGEPKDKKEAIYWLDLADQHGYAALPAARGAGSGGTQHTGDQQMQKHQR